MGGARSFTVDLSKIKDTFCLNLLSGEAWGTVGIEVTEGRVG